MVREVCWRAAEFRPDGVALSQQKKLGQFPTPVWFAELLIERFFPRLGAPDLILEPSCGSGAFLQAIPDHVRAVGVELDPLLAEQARRETGRQVITGDFRAVALDLEPTLILGNPPFRVELIRGFLDRAHALLHPGGEVGFILPAAAFQTARTFLRFAERWSISQEMIPRNVFDRISVPLIFARMRKGGPRVLVGFALYRESFDVLRIGEEYRAAIREGRGVWRRLTMLALRRLGGRARLAEIYGELEGRRPGSGQFWREKIRQTLRIYAADFEPIGSGEYRLVDS